MQMTFLKSEVFKILLAHSSVCNAYSSTKHDAKPQSNSLCL